MRQVLAVVISLFCLRVFAADYSQDFYEALDKKDYVYAEMILTLWEAENKDAPEAIIARFNLLVNKAHKSHLILDSDTNSSSGEALMFEDEEGNPAGIIRSGASWNDRLVNEAVKVIDHGIGLYPDRLDLRFGKATLYQFIENWDAFSAAAIDVLERAQANECKWLWADNEVLVGKAAKDNMLEAIHEYERTLTSATGNQELLDRNLKYYPDDHIALTLKGALAYDAADKDATLEYMNRAHRAAPDDMLIVCNLAYLYKEKGDIGMAKKLYQSVLDNPTADREWKLEAEQFFKQLDAAE